MSKPTINLFLSLSMILLTGCQTPPINQGQANSNDFEFSIMLSKAESCIESNGNNSQCYQKAFPQRCRNFAIKMNSNKSTIKQKMNNCVSACQQSTIATRYIGACSIIL
jgi:hypothetical protein